MATKSPCLECDHHLQGGDKNSDRCRQCNLRVDYVKNIGCLASNVPDHLTDYVEKEETVMETKSDQVVQTKICSNSECPFKGIPQSLDDYDNQASTRDGKSSNCKTCRRRIQAQYRKRKKSNKSPAQKTAPEKRTVDVKMSEKPDDKIIRLDFSRHDDIYDDLLKMADEQLRTPENQAMFIFKLIYEMGLEQFQVAEQLKLP